MTMAYFPYLLSSKRCVECTGKVKLGLIKLYDANIASTSSDDDDSFDATGIIVAVVLLVVLCFLFALYGALYPRCFLCPCHISVYTG